MYEKTSASGGKLTGDADCFVCKEKKNQNPKLSQVSVWQTRRN